MVVSKAVLYSLPEVCSVVPDIPGTLIPGWALVNCSIIGVDILSGATSCVRAIGMLVSWYSVIFGVVSR